MIFWFSTTSVDNLNDHNNLPGPLVRFHNRLVTLIDHANC